MRQKKVLASQSRFERGVRILLALAAALIGYFAVTHTLGLVMRSKAPELAHRLSPTDARILGQLSTKLADFSASTADRARADVFARQAVQRDATVVSAVATLGLNAQIRGDSRAARRWFSYSNRLSRRELRTRLWLIEDAVMREDIPGAIRNYDIALRTSRSARDLLFPILSNASANPAISDELQRTLVAQPAWSQDFIQFVASNGQPRETVRLLSRLRKIGVPITDTAHQKLMSSLIQRSFFQDAWRYYASLREGVARDRSRDPDFAADLAHPLPFDWETVTAETGISATIQRAEKDGIFDFFVPPSVGGLLLQQLQMLPPGRYVLEGNSRGIDQPAESRPYWKLHCVGGRELGRFPITNSRQNGGRFVGDFSVPNDCNVQYLSLVARSSTSITGVTGQINRVLLHRTARQ